MPSKARSTSTSGENGRSSALERRFPSGSEGPPPTGYLPAYWVEQVAAKVLPSVVTLQVNDDDHSRSGSGIILTLNGLIMTNNHVVAGVGTVLHVPPRSVVTLNDGRTAGLTDRAISQSFAPKTFRG